MRRAGPWGRPCAARARRSPLEQRRVDPRRLTAVGGRLRAVRWGSDGVGVPCLIYSGPAGRPFALEGAGGIE